MHVALQSLIDPATAGRVFSLRVLFFLSFRRFLTFLSCLVSCHNPFICFIPFSVSLPVHSYNERVKMWKSLVDCAEKDHLAVIMRQTSWCCHCNLPCAGAGQKDDSAVQAGQGTTVQAIPLRLWSACPQVCAGHGW